MSSGFLLFERYNDESRARCSVHTDILRSYTIRTVQKLSGNLFCIRIYTGISRLVWLKGLMNVGRWVLFFIFELIS